MNKETHLFEHRPYLQRYMDLMDSSMKEKIADVYPYLQKYATQRNRSIFLSIGAGTGKLEHHLAKLLPYSTVIASDLSLPMLQKINGHSEPLSPQELHDLQHKQQEGQLMALQANAIHLPVQTNSLDGVIASSVVHEIASFLDNHEYGTNTKTHIQQVGRALKPGGSYILRDFIQPSQPQELVMIEIGGKQLPTDMDPALFLDRFSKEFLHPDINLLQQQLQELQSVEGARPGAVIQGSADLAFEIAAHYSWAHSFDNEVKERYGYYPLSQQAEFIQEAWTEIGINSNIIETKSYLQPGYPEHILGRFNFYQPNGDVYPLPDFTGVIVIEKA